MGSGRSVYSYYFRGSFCMYIPVFYGEKIYSFSKYIPTLVITSLIGLVMYIVINKLAGYRE